MPLDEQRQGTMSLPGNNKHHNSSVSPIERNDGTVPTNKEPKNQIPYAICTVPQAEETPTQAQGTVALSGKHKHNNRPVSSVERNSKVDLTIPTNKDTKNQTLYAICTVPQAEENPNDITEELWWKDIHEPIDKIVGIIQKQFRIFEVDEITPQ